MSLDLKNNYITKLFFLMVIAASSVVLSSCGSGLSTGQKEPFGYIGSHKSRYPISVKSGSKNISVPIYEQYGGISRGQLSQVGGFLQQFNLNSGSNLEILIPRGSYNENLAGHSSEKIIKLASQNGIPLSQISYGGYPASGQQNAPIKIQYKKYTAHAENCPGITSQIKGDHLNTKYESFGCATQFNMAKMIANPKDLLGPAGYSPPSVDKIYDTYQKYIKEQQTNDNEGSQNASFSGIGG